MKTMNLQEILTAYIDCALWSSVDDEQEPLNVSRSASDLSDEARESMKDDCENFLLFCEERKIDLSEWSDEQFGHDFWLTRNGHGAGFWDRGLKNGDILAGVAKAFGSCDLYVNKEGKIEL